MNPSVSRPFDEPKPGVTTATEAKLKLRSEATSASCDTLGAVAEKDHTVGEPVLVE